ncbi:hypothetical protein Cgig2_024780 [Carnegiea gigantea]|uniref:Uncharacterized protein n=1 Tax=Carnegiea gigantea TaxID=171969 RepID=A0A9Q1K3N1_9CARY|nr:hypothetical protein Cgig2_024780 [Carnegiea gigantea]
MLAVRMAETSLLHETGSVHLSICRASPFSLSRASTLSLSLSLFHCRRCRSAVIGARHLSRSSARRCTDFYRFAVYASPLNDWILVTLAFFIYPFSCQIFIIALLRLRAVTVFFFPVLSFFLRFAIVLPKRITSTPGGISRKDNVNEYEMQRKDNVNEYERQRELNIQQTIENFRNLEYRG